MTISRVSLVAAVVLVLGVVLMATAAPKIKAGDKAPDFSLKSTSGSTVKLSDYRGKRTVLVEFFTTDCPWCDRAAPGTRKLAARYKGKPFQVVAVHVGENSSAGVRRWASSNKYADLPVLLDSGKTRDAYG
ncbi:MAG: TlpA disulfide reductase family protein, partial [Candidatus Brocadiaceae bacterium]